MCDKSQNDVASEFESVDLTSYEQETRDKVNEMDATAFKYEEESVMQSTTAQTMSVHNPCSSADGTLLDIAANSPDPLLDEYLRFLPQKFNAQSVTWQHADACALCDKAFSRISLYKKERRTHCRRCGQSVCGYCCENMMRLC